MPIISVFSGNFCSAKTVVQEVQASTGYHVLSDTDIVADAHALSGVAEEKLKRAFAAKASVFNKFTREKETAVAYLRLALARRITEDNIIINGFAGQLIPANISHLLRVALIGDQTFRLAEAASRGLSAKEAPRLPVLLTNLAKMILYVMLVAQATSAQATASRGYRHESAGDPEP